MFAQKFVTGLRGGFKKDRRTRLQKVDIVAEQVKEMLQTADQKLILMVRG